MNKVIAIDLGGSNLRVALIDENLNIEKLILEPTTKDDEDLLYSQIKRMIDELTSSLKIEVNKIGISAAGFISNGIIKYSPNLNIRNFDLVSLLKKDYPNVKIKLANDANCSALAEAKFGSGANYKTVVFMTISTGIGVGLVENGQLVDLPLELGHEYIFYKNRYFEAEQLISGTGIVNLARLNNLNVKNAHDFFEKVLSKDINAKRAYEDWLRITASFISNIQVAFNADCFILSGGVLKSKAIFLSDLQSVANGFVLPFPVNHIRLTLAKFNQDVGIISAASLVLA